MPSSEDRFISGQSKLLENIADSSCWSLLTIMRINAFEYISWTHELIYTLQSKRVFHVMDCPPYKAENIRLLALYQEDIARWPWLPGVRYEKVESSLSLLYWIPSKILFIMAFLHRNSTQKYVRYPERRGYDPPKGILASFIGHFRGRKEPFVLEISDLRRPPVTSDRQNTRGIFLSAPSLCIEILTWCSRIIS